MHVKMNLKGKGWGGRRAGAGKKRRRSVGISHRQREKISMRTPMHITLKYKTHLRNKTTLKILKRAIVNARTLGLRVLHFSFQTNHIHLIVEADSNQLLTKGMRSLTITFAKRTNLGRIQLERYHLHVLRNLRETRNAIFYVLFNQQKHEKGICSNIDGYSSVLNLKNGLELVKEFARKKRRVLKIGKSDEWVPDKGISWLATFGIK